MYKKQSIGRQIFKSFGINRKRSSKTIINLYDTNYEKNVLISYIVSPFVTDNTFTHQNFLTSHIIAESFSELGYNVDIVDYTDATTLVNFTKYSVIFGFGEQMEKSFYAANRNVPRILFITGAHADLHNKMALKSITDFYKLTGKWLPAESNVFPVNHYYSMNNADACIILARGFVLDHCKSKYPHHIHSLNNNIIGSFRDFRPKTYKTRNRNILYLSGTRLLQKGLSILFEVARLRRDLNFYIVVHYLGAELADHYKAELTDSANIFLSTSLRMDSIEMREIVEKCSYCVAPSYIDGFPGGTLEPMSAGLIPIVSNYCGFPPKEFIIEMEELSPSALNKSINRALALDDDTYLRYSVAAKEYTLENFSINSVKKSLLEILECELSDNNRING